MESANLALWQKQLDRNSEIGSRCVYTDTPHTQKIISKTENKQQLSQKVSEQEKWCSSGGKASLGSKDRNIRWID